MTSFHAFVPSIAREGAVRSSSMEELLNDPDLRLVPIFTDLAKAPFNTVKEPDKMVKAEDVHAVFEATGQSWPVVALGVRGLPCMLYSNDGTVEVARLSVPPGPAGRKWWNVLRRWVECQRVV